MNHKMQNSLNVVSRPTLKVMFLDIFKNLIYYKYNNHLFSIQWTLKDL